MRIPLNASTFGPEEIEAAIRVLKSDQITMGPLCLEFENVFAKYLNVKNAIFVNSGSSANLLAFFALANPAAVLPKGLRALKPGSEVLVPAVTWSTSVWPIVQAGGVPVLVDSDPRTLQMDVAKAEKEISDKTVGICTVHVLGNAVPWSPLQALAEKHNLWIMEDTCESLGTKHNGVFCGTRGLLGTYSFYFSHHITTIEGGMVVTNDDELAELLRVLRAHGWTRHLKNRQAVEARYPDVDPRFLFINTGFNLRSTEINAAFGLEQLKKLSGFNTRRAEIAESWRKSFATLTERGLLMPMTATEKTDCTWFGYPVLCQSTQIRNDLMSHLESSGIETRPVICGNLARQPAFKLIPHRTAADLSGADAIMDKGLFWGSHPMMQTEEIDYVTKTVRAFFERI